MRPGGNSSATEVTKVNASVFLSRKMASSSMSQTRAWPDGLITFALFGLSVGVIAFVLAYMGRGFDFTDEANYLVWMKDPSYYDFSSSQFGFIYSPLFHLLGQDPHLMRSANIILTYGMGLVLSYVTLKALDGQRHFAVGCLAQAMALATVSVTFLFWSPPTPSYNNLSLQALMLTAVGLVRADKDAGWASLAGWVLIGIGGWMAFMAKVSTAAMLGPLVLLLVLLSGRWSFRGLAIAIVSASFLLVASAYFIDGSLTAFWGRISVALEISALSGAGYTLAEILRWDSIELNAADWNIAIATMIGLLVAGVLFRLRPSALATGLAVTISLLCCLMTALIMLRIVPPDSESGRGARTVLLAFPTVSLALALPVLVRWVAAGEYSKTSTAVLRNYALGLGFMALPLVYAFGSNNNYWNLAGDACIFWVLAGVLFGTRSEAARGGEGRHIPYALAAPLLSVFFLQHGLAKPYRQPQPLWLDNQPVEFGNPPHSLTLSSGFATYIEEASRKAHAAGFQPGTPTIDLSGQSPGILFAIGARNVGYPWLLGGYPGSAAVVKAALERMTCRDLADSWVLLERNGPRAVDSSVLSVFGASVEDDFEVVAQWSTAAGAGGYAEVRSQELLRPTRALTEAIADCSALR